MRASFGGIGWGAIDEMTFDELVENWAEAQYFKVKK
jgi:hypothetical protein